jgi:hypothetical protein
VDWEAVHGLMESAIYGGRIENQRDVRVLTYPLLSGVALPSPALTLCLSA